MKTLLKNVVLDRCNCDILIENGRIAEIAPAISAPDAEIFDGNSTYASKIVSVSTIISLITMPLVALLLYI